MKKNNQRIILILLIIIILLCMYLYYCQKENFSINNKYDVVISINVHEKPDFLLKQLENIKIHMLCSYCIILNCNDFMYEECKKIDLPSNVYLHPEILNKKWGHGSLFRGIYNNIVYALQNIEFQYFIVLSSRNMFQYNLYLENIKELLPFPTGLDETDVQQLDITHINDDTTISNWHWSSFINTKLAKYYIQQQKNLYGSPHEGLCLSYHTCKKIYEFLDSNPDITQDLSDFSKCVEEFALQTIAMNTDSFFYYIGTGCCTEETIPPNQNKKNIKKYVYKVKRE
jgi:hypothetical protein